MIDTRQIVSRLKAIESLAVIPRVSSTNEIARLVLDECIDNDLSLPQAIIIAGEQFAGRGRHERRWSSPAGKGIYATTLLTRTTAQLPLVPLDVANIVATYLRDTFAIDARLKWPNDIVVGGRKIAGILIEARVQDTRAYLAIGTGVNIEPFESDQRPNAIAVAQLQPRGYAGLDAATTSFIEHLDRRLSVVPAPRQVLDEWRALTVHREGDRITCVLPDRTIEGSWQGIDEHGTALIEVNGAITRVSAGDIMTG